MIPLGTTNEIIFRNLEGEGEGGIDDVVWEDLLSILVGLTLLVHDQILLIVPLNL